MRTLIHFLQGPETAEKLLTRRTKYFAAVARAAIRHRIPGEAWDESIRTGFWYVPPRRSDISDVEMLTVQTLLGLLPLEAELTPAQVDALRCPLCDGALLPKPKEPKAGERWRTCESCGAECAIPGITES